VTWEYTGAVRLDRIDAEKSLNNQARVYERLDEDTVTTYAEAIKRGDKFPAVVAHRSSARGKLIMVDGNHRMFGYRRAEVPEIPAYIITRAKQTTVVMMTFAANTRHGKPTSHDERIHQAIWLINNGASQEEAAAAVQLKKGDVAKAWPRVQGDQGTDEMGILRCDWDQMPASPS
jgi:ParB-like chromosome segregation protein Spo0J